MAAKGDCLLHHASKKLRDKKWLEVLITNKLHKPIIRTYVLYFIVFKIMYNMCYL